MGVRAGQGYGQAKPKRRCCPQCNKHGVTQWQATANGLVRHCQYCQMSWGEAGWQLATGVVNHVSHPYKVEGRDYSRMPSILIGRVMFKTQEEAQAYANGTGDGGHDLSVLRSKPGDVEFA